MRVIDLFAGCGGLSLGFRQAGFDVIKAVEVDPGIAKTYTANHPETEMIVDDIQNIDGAGVFQEGDADVVIGGPPCQGFSMAGARIRGGFIDDPRNYLFRHYFNVVRTVRPAVFVMENVKGITTMQGGKIFEEILGIFSNPELLGGRPYHLHHRLVRAVQFGIPQKRERMLVIGTTKENVDFDALWQETEREVRREYPHYFDPVTVRDAIGNLGETTEDGRVENPVPVTEYQRYLACEDGFIANHTRTRHSRIATDRMHRVRGGENFTVLEENIRSVHSGSYGRLDWDEQAPTITTRFDTPAGGRFTHPVEDRTLSPREAARVQSFPDDFVFCGTRTSIGKQIGNAVPPKISYFLAKLTARIMDEGGDRQ